MEGYESCERYAIQEMEQCDTLGHLDMKTGYIISRASCVDVQYRTESSRETYKNSDPSD